MNYKNCLDTSKIAIWLRNDEEQDIASDSSFSNDDNIHFVDIHRFNLEDQQDIHNYNNIISYIMVALGHSPLKLYVGQIVYKVKCQTEWFTIYLYLNILILFKGTLLVLNDLLDIVFIVHRCFTETAKKDITVFFKFLEENGY